MEKDKQKRPTDRGKTTVSRERPRSPAARPKDPRPRSGNAVSREAARRERLAGSERSAGARADRPARSAGQERTAGERTLRQEKAPRQEKAARQEKAPRQDKAAKKKQAARARTASPEDEVPARSKKRAKKPHRVYNTNFGIKFAVMLAVVAVIVLSMVIFFKIKHINVVPMVEEGARSYYTEEEIIAASGINLDDNLLSMSKVTAAARIHAALPYVNEVQIKKQLPGTVVITFSEFEVTYAIQDETGGWWLMSREGRILEPVEEQAARSHLRVTGMPIQVPQVGDYFKPAATEGADMSEISAKQKVVLDVIPALEGASFVKQIDRVDVSTSYDLTLWWTGDRYEIRLGTTERLAYKLQFLQAALENEDIRDRSGTLDLTFNEDNKVHFLPFQ